MSALNPLFAALVAERKRVGMTRVDMARRLGYSTSAVQWWETGRSCPTFEAVTDYATVLGFTLALQSTAAPATGFAWVDTDPLSTTRMEGSRAA
ncbi:helix-turn-helix transcriptional regulator [Nocardiopsis sp. NPDC049922]|uniref:helix-turn-helix domain-containing protein n=1 Tax=Nocardiopsis sp. NPDC049922 TaxID=3155157 RepID=UPI0033F1B4F7